MDDLVSFIAAALAKSKGKDVQPPPESGVVPTPPDFAAFPPPLASGEVVAAPGAGNRPAWLMPAAITVGLAAVALGVWLMFFRDGKKEEPPAKPIASAPAAAQPKPAPVTATPVPQLAKPVETPKPTPPAVSTPAQTPAPAPVAKAPAPAAKAPEPVVNPPSEELMAMVMKFSVSAVMPGANGRAVINGRRYFVGDEVAPGLTLKEIKEGQLVFADAEGNVYPRRF